MRNSKPLP